MATLAADVRYALRILWKNKGFTAIAAFVLALGIGANSTVFALVNTMALKPRVGHPQGELVSLFSKDTTKPDSYRAFSWAMYEQLRQRTDVFSHLTAHNLTMVGLREGDTTRRLFADVVSAEFFNVYGAPPVLGRAFSADEEKPGANVPVVILSYPLWQRLGGQPSVLGQTVTINNRAYNVIGVAPRGFGGAIVSLVPDAFLPMGAYDALSTDFTKDGMATTLADPRHFNLVLEGQLVPGATIESVNPLLKATSMKMAAEDPGLQKDREVFAAKMSRMSISTSPQDDSEVYSLAAVLLAMSMVILCIASFNLANMLLARNGARAKEFAIRMAIGSGRMRVVRQLVTEGFVLALIGGIGGLALATYANQLIVASLTPLMPVTVSLDVAPDLRIIAATFGFCAVATVLFSLAPALRLARTNIVPELKEQAGELGRRSRFAMRDVLVMAQLALSLVMLTAAGLFLKGAVQAAQVNPGFTFERGLIVNVDASLAGRTPDETRLIYQRVNDRLRATPGVAASGFASIMPFGEFTESRSVQKPGATVEGARGASTSMQIGGSSDGSTRSDLVSSISTTVGTGYFDALGLKVLNGRDFTDAEVFSPEKTHVVIVDDVLATRLFGNLNVVGQQIQYKGRQDGDPPVVLDIVGVVPGLKHNITDAEPVAHIYTPLSQDPRASVFFHVRTALPTAEAEAALLPALRQVLRDVDASLPVVRMETRAQYAERNFMLAIIRVGAGIFGVFGVVALILASIGVYGVKSYIVSRRTREIGIRMALGATPQSVVNLVIKEGAVLSTIGLTVGLGLSLLVAQGLRSLLFQANAIDPIATGGALIVLVASVLAASIIPARRATKVPPTLALRS